MRGLCETARVFGHDHEGEQIAERIDHLMAAVFVADDGRAHGGPDPARGP